MENGLRETALLIYVTIGYLRCCCVLRNYSSVSVSSTPNESDRADDHDDDGEEESCWDGSSDLGTRTSHQLATESKKISRKRKFLRTKSSSEIKWQ